MSYNVTHLISTCIDIHEHLKHNITSLILSIVKGVKYVYYDTI